MAGEDSGKTSSREQRSRAEAAREGEASVAAAVTLSQYLVREDPPVVVTIIEDVDGRRFYNIEEPSLTEIGARVLERLRRRILRDMSLLRRFSSIEDFGEGIREAFMLARRVLAPLRGRLRRLGRELDDEASRVAYYIARDLVGYGRLDPLIRDPHIEDISCNGVLSPIFVYHSEFEWLTSNIVFNDPAELEQIVLKLGLRAGQEPSLARPVVEGILRPEGYRVHIVLDVVSRRGHSFTIRKFRAEPFTVIELVNRGTLDPGIVAVLWAAIQYKQGVVIYGPTGSGKTTLLNALAMLLPPEYKIVTIEDTPEIYLPFHDNWAAMHTRLSDMPGVQNVTLQAQVESALRMRPDVIIVGEIRSREAFAFFQALATGHGGLTTVHAESADVLIRRLASPPMSVPKSLIAATRLFVHILRLERGGRVARKVVRVDETRGYDVARDEVSLARLIQWRSKEDDWILVSGESSFVSAIAEILVTSPREVWHDLERRATVVKWLAEKGADMLELHEVVRRYMREPDRVYEEALAETTPYSFRRPVES